MSDFLKVCYIYCGFYIFTKIMEQCNYPNNKMYIEEYAGCDCRQYNCIPLDTIVKYNTTYKRIKKSNKHYNYYKIYNVTQDKWAYNISNDIESIKNINNWNEYDALLGFYKDNKYKKYNVIFCRPKYAIFINETL